MTETSILDWVAKEGLSDEVTFGLKGKNASEAGRESSKN